MISRDPCGSRNRAGACRRSSVRRLCRDFDQTNRQSNVAGGFTCLIASVSPLSVFPNERRRVTPVVERSSPCDAEHAIERMVRGNQSGLVDLYDRHRGFVYALALRVLHDRGDAEDVVQEFFWQVWRQALRFDTNRANFHASRETMVKVCCRCLLSASTRRARCRSPRRTLPVRNGRSSRTPHPHVPRDRASPCCAPSAP